MSKCFSLQKSVGRSFKAASTMLQRGRRSFRIAVAGLRGTEGILLYERSMRYRHTAFFEIVELPVKLQTCLMLGLQIAVKVDPR